MSFLSLEFQKSWKMQELRKKLKRYKEKFCTVVALANELKFNTKVYSQNLHREFTFCFFFKKWLQSCGRIIYEYALYFKNQYGYQNEI